MKPTLTAILLILGILTTTRSSHAQGTAFTYNGRLNDNGAAANANYDMTFNLYDAENGGNLVAGAVSLTPVPVVNGLFAVKIDFGAAAFTGADRWLEVSVRRTGTPAFTTLVPRQGLTSSPYAIYASTAANVAANSIGAAAIQNGSISAAKIAPGQVVTSLNVNGLSLSDAVTLQAGANVFLTPSGNTLTLSASSGGSGLWGQNGPDAFYTAGHVGIGTSTPAENLSIAGVPSYNNGLKLTGSSVGGTGLALENTSTGGHKYSLFSAGSGDSVGAGGFGIYDDTTASYSLAISAGGNVGIGTAVPMSPLTVKTGSLFHYGIEHTDGNVRLSTYINSIGGWLGTVSNHKLHFYVNNGSPSMTIDTTGNVGIGTTAPTVKLEINGDMRATRLSLRADPGAPANAAVLCEDPNVANFVPYNTANGRPLSIIVRDAFVRQLTINGGADIAEPFKMSTRQIPKGAVVIIDEQNPGQLQLSTQAYDTRVAGIISGANGIQPGISLHQEGSLEGGENVALSGRVYVQADATMGAIRPGDLLTTSDTPGHAMKVTDHAKAQGAILGKAMSSLKEGKGMVLVLVTLQ
jgi:hypothetical protein